MCEIFYKPHELNPGPADTMITKCKKYVLFKYLLEAVTQGCCIGLPEWKKRVRDHVMEMDKRQISIGCSLYKVLDYLRFREDLKLSVWWELSFRYPVLAKQVDSVIRMCLNVARYGFNVCQFCSYACNDTIEHIIFECKHYKYERDLYWTQVLAACPERLRTEIMSMSNKDRAIFLLNGMNCDFVQEWCPLYYNIAQLVYALTIRYNCPDS